MMDPEEYRRFQEVGAMVDERGRFLSREEKLAELEAWNPEKTRRVLNDLAFFGVDAVEELCFSVNVELIRKNKLPTISVWPQTKEGWRLAPGWIA